MQDHRQQEDAASATDDLQIALLASATMATKRTTFLSKPQLQRSHERLKRNIQRRQEQLLVTKFAGLDIHDSSSPIKDQAVSLDIQSSVTPIRAQEVPDHIIEQLYAYDALTLAKARIAKQDRTVVRKMEKMHIHSLSPSKVISSSSPTKVIKRISPKKSPSPVLKRGKPRGILKKPPSPPSMNLETEQGFAATAMYAAEAAMASIPPRSSQKKQVRFAPEAILSTWKIVEKEEKQVRFAPTTELNIIDIEEKKKEVRFAPEATENIMRHLRQ